MKLRIVRVQIDQNVAEVLNEISSAYLFDDKGFAEDLFVLIRRKGSGLPTDDRIHALAKVMAKIVKVPELVLRTMITHRRHVLQSVLDLPAVRSLMATKTEPLSAVRQSLALLKSMTVRRRQAQCTTCQFLNSCQYGQKHFKAVTNISYVSDPLWKTLLNPSCPHASDIEGLNTVLHSANQLATLNSNTLAGKLAIDNDSAGDTYSDEEEEADDLESETDEQDGATDEGVTTEPDSLTEDELLDDQRPEYGPTLSAGKSGNVGSHTGRHFASVQMDFVKRMSATTLQLFEIGRVLHEQLTKHTKGKYLPTKEVSADSHTRTIEETSEVARADTVEHSLTDDELDLKLAKGELRVTGNTKPEEKKHLLYILIDESGSMRGYVAPNGNTLITRGQLAATLAAVMCERVGSEKGIVYLRFFSTSVHQRFSAEKPTEFQDLIKYITDCDFSGGGTAIGSSLFASLEDIERDAAKLSKAEILLITDMDDKIAKTTENSLESKLKKLGTKLHCINVNSFAPGPRDNAESVLLRLSTKYFKSDPANIDLTKIVAAVK